MARTTCVLLLLFLMTGTAQADRWPLYPGWSWTYQSDYQGQSEYVEVLEQTQVVRGVECIVLLKELDQIGGLERAHYFLTKNAEGDVWMHGFEDIDEGEERQVSLDPPVLVLDQPMVMGALWSTRSTSYLGLEVGGAPIWHFIETYKVDEDKFFELNFGTRQAYGLVKWFWVNPDPPEGAVDIEWTPQFSALDNGPASIFFSEGIGIVLEYTLWLTSYSQTVAAEQATWSELKRQFR